MVKTERERKFLVIGLYEGLITGSRPIVQGYIAASERGSVRVRISNDRAKLNIKGRSSADGLSRSEWEKEISLDEARDLLLMCSGTVIEKIRHLVPYNGHTIEVDEFMANNAGLLMAEVEFESDEAAAAFVAPEWLGLEVTGDERFYNAYLSQHPYSEWDRNKCEKFDE